MQPQNRKRTKSGRFFKCPTCHKLFRIPSLKSHWQGNNATTDCPFCDELILITKGKAKKFHREMNKYDSRWPKDGHGTEWIQI